LLTCAVLPQSEGASNMIPQFQPKRKRHRGIPEPHSQGKIMSLVLGLFSLSFALSSAFCAGRAAGIGKQMQDASAGVVEESEGTTDDPERLEQVAGEMDKIGEGPLAQEYATWVQRAYIWGIAAVGAFFGLLVLS